MLPEDIPNRINVSTLKSTQANLCIYHHRQQYRIERGGMNAWGNCKQEPEYQLFIKQCCVCMYYAKVVFTVFLFHSARTGGQSSGVISQSTNRRVGLRCYFIVHEHEVGVRCYLIVHEPEGKGQVLFHSARTAGQGSEQNVQCTMFRRGVTL